MFLILIINSKYVTTFSVAFDVQKHFCLNKSKAKSLLKESKTVILNESFKKQMNKR